MTIENRDLRNYITQAGFNEELLNKSLGRTTNLIEIGIGSGLLPDVDTPAEQTTLISEIKRFPVNSLTVDSQNPGVLIAEAVVPADEGGWTINEVGIYTDQGTLYAYARQPGDYKPLLNQGQGQDYLLRLMFIPSNAESIELKIDPAVVLATHAHVDNQIKTRVEDKRGIPDGFASLNDNGRLPVTELSIGFHRKNHIINGNFDIWQRGISETSANGERYLVDRFAVSDVVNGSITVSQQAFVLGQTDVPNNPRFYVNLNQTSGSYRYYQKIESVRALSGKTAVLSFYAKASTDLSIKAIVEQSFGTGGTPSSNVIIDNTSSYDLTVAWKKFHTKLIVPDIKNKTLGTDFNDYLLVGIELPFGAIKIDIAQIQLEEGELPSDFETRLIAEEFALCKRYYETGGWVIYSRTPNTIPADDPLSATYITFSAEKRGVPSIEANVLTHVNAPDVTVDSVTGQEKNGISFIASHYNLTGDNVIFNQYGQWSADAEL